MILKKNFNHWYHKKVLFGQVFEYFNLQYH